MAGALSSIGAGSIPRVASLLDRLVTMNGELSNMAAKADSFTHKCGVVDPQPGKAETCPPESDSLAGQIAVLERHVGNLRLCIERLERIA